MNEVRIIVGLGNPGREYQKTRHNAGFMVVEKLAAKWSVEWRLESKFFAQLAVARVGASRVILVEPQTYMNCSGEAVARVAGFYQVAAASVLVVVDDADLPLGAIRMRPGGSSGGHHGLLDIEKRLGTREYPRQRLGIARPESGVRDIAGHVLGRFGEDEWPLWEKVAERAVKQAEMWVEEGLEKAMGRWNGTV